MRERPHHEQIAIQAIGRGSFRSEGDGRRDRAQPAEPSCWKVGSKKGPLGESIPPAVPLRTSTTLRVKVPQGEESRVHKSHVVGSLNSFVTRFGPSVLKMGCFVQAKGLPSRSRVDILV